MNAHNSNIEPAHHPSFHAHANDSSHFHAPPPSYKKNRKFSLKYGVSRAIGGRDYQEDEYTCVEKFNLNGSPVLFGVFDGHGTDAYSTHASNSLHQLIFDSMLFKEGRYRDAIADGYAKEDRILKRQISKAGGSTSTTVIVVNNEVYVGNLGDSRAILVSKKGDEDLHIRRLTQDHKPTDPEEKGRILSAGGLVLCGRVVGPTSAIDTSRALGDFDFKLPLNDGVADFISSKPYVPSPVPLDPSHLFMVIASDGLWNEMNDETTANLVYQELKNGKTPTEVAEFIVHRCVLSGSSNADNITVIVVLLNWKT